MKHEHREKRLDYREYFKTKMFTMVCILHAQELYFSKIVELHIFYSLNTVLPGLAEVCFMLVYYVEE